MLSARQGANLRIGLIGAGAAGELHARAVESTPGLELVTVAVADARRAAALAARHGATASDVAGLLSDPTIDAVMIATPTATHLDLAHAALDAGKHVLVEKPVADSAAEIRQLASAAHERGLHAVPGHNYVHQPECRRLVRYVRDGALGRTRLLHISYALKHQEALAARYSGALTEIMVHHSYIALAALGRPETVSGGVGVSDWERLEADDQAWMVWEYASGAIAVMFATLAVDDLSGSPMTFSVKALGTEGSIGYSWRDATLSGDDSPFDVDIPLYRETYEHQAIAFRDLLRGDAAPASSLEDAAIVAELISDVRARGRVPHREDKP